MPQETPNIPQLPKDLQNQINLATQKVTVLKEEEIKISRSKADLEKDVARLEVTKSFLVSEMATMEAGYSSIKNNIDGLNKEIEREVEILESIKEEQKVIEKTLSEAKIKTVQEIEAASNAMVKIREEEEKLKIEKEKLEQEKQEFEVRKARVLELLSSI